MDGFVICTVYVGDDEANVALLKSYFDDEILPLYSQEEEDKYNDVHFTANQAIAKGVKHRASLIHTTSSVKHPVSNVDKNSYQNDAINE